MASNRCYLFHNVSALNKGKEQMARERKRGGEVKSDFAEPWEPGDGEEISGIYIGFDNVPTKRGDKDHFKSHRIQIEGKDVPIGISGAMIDRKMAQIPVGTFVWITFLGMVDTNNGEAKDYRVEAEEGTKLLKLGHQVDAD